ncbi:hypothetical protein Nepgr_027247 [Nepenthes gracilis]|uniref:Uncharacterized protein n=1 Tax=Nepenthes gracilis TaxID=150966 RepID=A0AAD3T9Z6_NEPGR|nr:hypothetical protein Nepgr_027247 [Nepenthes gracilis]
MQQSNYSWGPAAGGVRGCGISATGRNGSDFGLEFVSCSGSDFRLSLGYCWHSACGDFCYQVSGEYATNPADAMDEESRIILCLVAAVFLCEGLWLKQKFIMKLPLDVKLLMLIVQLSLSQGSSCQGYV